MNIAIAGTGNVAHVLGKMMLAAGHRITEVYGRNAAAASACAAELQARPILNLHRLAADTDVCIIAVADAAIGAVGSQLAGSNAIIVHTSGGTSIDVLKECSRYGVLYPLQSLRKELPYQPPVPLFIDGCNDEVTSTLEMLASSISNDVSQAGDLTRVQLHVAAVLCSNFTNHLYALAHHVCQQWAIDFHHLQPLITETANRLQYEQPALLQTGPAIRQDEPTILRHLQMLQPHQPIAAVYQALTNSIQQTALTGNGQA